MMGLLIHPHSHGIARGNTEKVLTTAIPAFALIMLSLAIPDLWPALTSEPLGVFNIFFTAIVLALLGALLAGRSSYHFAAAAALLFLVAFAAWQVGLLGQTSTEARPWSWGYAGAGLSMAAVAWRLAPTLIYGAAFSVLLTAVPLLPAGSTRSWEHSWQDGLLTAGMAIVITAPIRALRHASSAADNAADDALERFVVLARTRQLATQRARLDALAHDSILSTLIVAAQARDAEVLAAVRESASEALAKLDGFRLTTENHPEATVPFSELVQMVHDATASHKVEFSSPVVDAAADLEIPALIAEALIQASMEAVRNAVRHGGSSLPRVEIATKSGSTDADDVRIHIKDDGPGFDPGSVPPERLGITDSILGRMRRVSGEARIDSAPGRGTTVTLYWSRGGSGNG